MPSPDFCLRPRRRPSSLKFTVAGTTGDCSWSGTNVPSVYPITPKSSSNSAEGIVTSPQNPHPGRLPHPRSHHVPLTPRRYHFSVPAPIDMGGILDGHRAVEELHRPGLTRLNDEFTDALRQFTWDLEASSTRRYATAVMTMVCPPSNRKPIYANGGTLRKLIPCRCFAPA